MGLLDSEDPQFTLAPSARFAPGLLAPPREWFVEFPDWFDEVPLGKVWVDSEGRVAARTFGPTCLLDGDESSCWIPPASPTGYEAFHQGAVPFTSRQGSVVTVGVESIGVIGGRSGHAPVHLSFEQAAQWYANTRDQLMIGRAFDVEEDDGVHGYFLGAVLPHLTVEDVAMVRRSALSCDWRYRHRDNAGRPLNAYDNLGPWLVTRPGLPLDRRGHQRPSSVRYRALTASLGDPHPAYVLDTSEEDPMPPCDNHECTCKGARTAAQQPPPAQDPDNAPADGELVAHLQAKLTATEERVETLEGIVSKLLMEDIELDEIEV